MDCTLGDAISEKIGGKFCCDCARIHPPRLKTDESDASPVSAFSYLMNRKEEPLVDFPKRTDT